MALDITGKIIQVMPETGGVSKAGKDWKKQEFVIETIENYPKKIFLSTMNEKTAELRKFPVGSIITASLNIESREYLGRWYTDVRAWKITAGEGAQQATSGDPYKQQAANAPQQTFTNEPLPATSAPDDDLPF